MERVALAQQSSDPAVLESAVNNLWADCGGASAEGKILVTALTDQLIEQLLPPVERYFMWACENRTGLFNVNNVLIGESNNGADEEVAEMRMSFEDKKTREEEDELNAIVTKLHLDPAELYRVYETKEFLQLKKTAIDQAIRTFLNSKDTLVDELLSLHTFLEDHILSRLSYGDRATLLLWIHQVRLALLSSFIRSFTSAGQGPHSTPRPLNASR